MTHLYVIDDFFPQAANLRAAYDERMAHDVYHFERKRFIWDYWHAPPRFTYLRTPGTEFFEKAILDRFLTLLRSWSVENLGFHQVKSLWLSCYISGCGQHLHHDVGNGDWAFVYSLTRRRPEESSLGSTFVLDTERHAVWDWSDVERNPGRYAFTRVDPSFNRLVVFDSQLPHGVEHIREENDPLRARVVIHGWFSHGGLVVTGALRAAQIELEVQSRLPEVEEALESAHDTHGTAVARCRIAPSGRVTAVRFLGTTLRRTSELASEPQWLLERAEDVLRKWVYPEAPGPSTIWIPLQLA